MQKRPLTSQVRLAHISDLHFSHLSWNPLQFFSKRWIGNLNLLLTRKKEYAHQRLLLLPELFKNAAVDQVLITGDLSTTSFSKEFALAHDFIEALKASGLSVSVLPGNHDKYTKRADRDALFYQYFHSCFSEEEIWDLRAHNIAVRKLSPTWWLVLLDTALATHLFSSQGYFSPHTEAQLEKALEKIPENHQVILANHFPFFKGESRRVTLLRAEQLREKILKFPNIKLYLHGHAHRHCIADLRKSGYPIVLDSGSTPHRTNGAINLIDITTEGCDIQVLQWKEEWQMTRQVSCPW
jgi:3',5'-cyclic AMP phosphodiesterase CpdA